MFPIGGGRSGVVGDLRLARPVLQGGIDAQGIYDDGRRSCRSGGGSRWGNAGRATFGRRPLREHSARGGRLRSGDANDGFRTLRAGCIRAHGASLPAWDAFG